MGLFKLNLKVGGHVEVKNGLAYTYEAGDTLESDEDLVKKFPNKFTRMDVALEPGGNAFQPTIPVPHRFVKDESLVDSPVDKTGEAGDAKTGEAGDAKTGEAGDAKTGEAGDA